MQIENKNFNLDLFKQVCKDCEKLNTDVINCVHKELRFKHESYLKELYKYHNQIFKHDTWNCYKCLNIFTHVYNNIKTISQNEK